uniref:Putative ovule protein n=1 Tax=Solanum chacoense TaxID=4108 RepID=A0A0V0HBW6_SOLCH
MSLVGLLYPYLAYDYIVGPETVCEYQLDPLLYSSVVGWLYIYLTLSALYVGDGMHCIVCSFSQTLWFDPGSCIGIFIVHDEILFYSAFILNWF